MIGLRQHQACSPLPVVEHRDKEAALRFLNSGLFSLRTPVGDMDVVVKIAHYPIA